MVRRHRDDTFYYFRHLGQIIDLFSEVEADLQILLWREAGVSDAVGRAVFSGVRIEQSVQFCRRIWDATGEEHPPMLERAFVQLGHLNSARNDIVHYGAEFSEAHQQYVVTNERSAHTERAVRRHTLDNKTLIAISNDLIAVRSAIEAHHRQGADGPDFTYAQLLLLGSRPWEYKPPQPAPPPRNSPSKPQGRS